MHNIRVDVTEGVSTVKVKTWGLTKRGALAKARKLKSRELSNLGVPETHRIFERHLFSLPLLLIGTHVELTAQSEQA